MPKPKTKKVSDIRPAAAEPTLAAFPPEVRAKLQGINTTLDEIMVQVGLKKAMAAEPAKQTPSLMPSAPPGSLTRLLKLCIEFECDATKEDRELLCDTLESWKKSPYSFTVEAASTALDRLKASPGVDALDNENFCRLLNLFGDAVSGWGYGGFREQLIKRLLEDERGREMKPDDVMAIMVIEMEDMHGSINAARQALEEYPEELAAEIAKATEELKKRSMEASNAD